MASHESSEFGTLLRRYRATLELTQEALAEAAGLSVRGLSDLERSVKTRPHQFTVRQLADALALSPTDRAVFEAAARSGRARAQTVRASRDSSVPIPGLPIPPTPLIGRVGEVAAICELVRHERVRLLTLLGTGGTGKTRLAIEATGAVAHAFPDGATFVSLASVSGAHLVMPTIAGMLDVKELAHESHRDTVLQFFNDRATLLVLDNFEHVVDAAEDIGELLNSCLGLTILVTSRIPLHLAAEREYPVRPLPVPDPHSLPDWMAVGQSDAIQLFVDRAQAVRPDFVLTAENTGAVVDICARLDGLPLAIELAAARIRVFEPHMMVQRLDQRLHLLTGGPRDVPVRQQTLRATIDWSYELLTGTEQRLLAQLAVFAGGFDLHAAEFVCQVSPETGTSVLDVLISLVEKGLIRQASGRAPQLTHSPRFSMLETILEYALERLEASAEGETIRRRHAEYVARLAEDAEQHFDKPEQGLWHSRLDEELDNIRTALAWALLRDQPEIALRIAGPLMVFWERRNHITEGIRWLTQALDHNGPAEPILRAGALRAAGGLMWRQGIVNESAISMLEESVSLYRKIGDDGRTAGALQNLGLAIAFIGDLPRAEALFHESLLLHRKQDSQQGVALILNNLALISCQRGHLTEAQFYVEEALELSRTLQNAWGIAINAGLLGRIAHDQGRFVPARTYNVESLLTFQDVGDRMGIAWALSEFGHLAIADGQLVRAARLLSVAERLLRQIGMPVDRVEEYVQQVRAAMDQQAWDRAWAEGQAMALDEAVEYGLRV